MDNRQLATVILAAVIAVCLLVFRPTRQAIPGLVRAFFAPKLIIPLVLYCASLVGLIWLADRVGLWVPGLWSDTVFWFVLGGAAWYFSIGKAARDPDFFKNKLIESIGLAAFFEFFVSVNPLPLLGEIILIVVLTLLYAMKAVSEPNSELRKVAPAINWLIEIITVGIFSYVIWHVVAIWDELDISFLWRQLLLPIWLTIVSVPFIYLVALCAAYEVLFLRLHYLNEQKAPRWSAWFGVMAALRGNIVDVNCLTGARCGAAANASSFKAAYGEAVASKVEWHEDQLTRAANRDRLIQNAGLRGVDERGRQLDRREFAATKAALEWLATCHMGWYSRGGKYRADLLTGLGDFKQQGLPGDHGIHMKVSRNGQAWYAYRQTVTGWYFAIGGKDRLPSQWYYDGRKSPSGQPDARHGWSGINNPVPVEWLPADKT